MQEALTAANPEVPKPVPAVHWGPLWSRELEQAENVVGILVCHGMGQQVRYETISAVAGKIRDEAKAKGGQAGAVKVHLGRAEDQFIARAEVDWVDSSGQPHEVHVYEAYWAPLTEGRVTFWDTLWFLLSAGGSGLRHSKLFRTATFRRWMFGDWRSLKIGPATFIGLLLTLAVLTLAIVLIAWGLAIAYADIVPQIRQALSMPPGVAWVTPLIPGLNDLRHWTSLDWALRNRALGRFWLGVVAAVAAYYFRYFLVQFVGDVAAYISPYKSSKFDEVRRNIQKAGLDVGKVVYGLDPTGTRDYPNYSRIVVVGHSLGSVVAYDTLNALINIENTGAIEGRAVMRRTRALVTFGSPLDKTAFIFRMQRQDLLREQMVAAMQPLIVDYDRFRPPKFNWVNIWSRTDVISGALNYYDRPDLPENDPRRVENMQDAQARKPLAAHVQYWENDMLREQLYRFVS